MDAARFDFRQVSEQFGEEFVGSTDQAARTGEQVVVGDVLETVGGTNIGMLDAGIGGVGMQRVGGI